MVHMPKQLHTLANQQRWRKIMLHEDTFSYLISHLHHSRSFSRPSLTCLLNPWRTRTTQPSLGWSLSAYVCSGQLPPTDSVVKTYLFSLCVFRDMEACLMIYTLPFLLDLVLYSCHLGLTYAFMR